MSNKDALVFCHKFYATINCIVQPVKIQGFCYSPKNWFNDTKIQIFQFANLH